MVVISFCRAAIYVLYLWVGKNANWKITTIMYKNSYLLALACLFCYCFVQAQSDQDDAQAIDYISTYKDLAVSEMHRTAIPASITLAQGLLESDFGRSRLAVKAKNHFGLKCRKDWKGETIRHTDDAPNECFRKFRTVEDSYKNHSRFLQRNRYRFLFSIDNKDYAGWAHGLKKAGYATDPYYAFKLINLIERYSLQVYDMMEYLPDGEIIAYKPKPEPKPQIRLAAFSSVNGKQIEKLPSNNIESVVSTDYKIGKLNYQKPIAVNKIKAVRFPIAVLPVQISETYNIKLEDLLALNDMESNDYIPEYTNIYLEKRNRKTRKANIHLVKNDEKIRDIALIYGVDMKSIYRMNKMEDGTEPVAGEIVYLKKSAPSAPIVYTPNNKIEEFEEVMPELDEERTIIAENLSTPSPEKEATVVKTGFKEERTFISEKDYLKSIGIEDSNDEFVVKSAPVTASPVSSEPKPEKKAKEFETYVHPVASKTSTPERRVVIYKSKAPENIVNTSKNTYIRSGGDSNSVLHTVAKGENLYRISLKYNVSVEELMRINNMNSNLIYAGSVIIIK